jgi:hypothetical protein
LGGHFLTYDTMHLTEFSRRCDVELSDDVTNSDHSDHQFLLARMALDLARRPGFSEYSVVSLILTPNHLQGIRRKPLTALCRMVLHPDDYYLKGDTDIKYRWCTSTFVDYAQEVCQYLVEKFKLLVGSEDDADDFLFDGVCGRTDWMAPGDVIDLGTELQTFKYRYRL